jgi:hypothetical protein
MKARFARSPIALLLCSAIPLLLHRAGGVQCKGRITPMDFYNVRGA